MPGDRPSQGLQPHARRGGEPDAAGRYRAKARHGHAGRYHGVGLTPLLCSAACDCPGPCGLFSMPPSFFGGIFKSSTTAARLSMASLRMATVSMLTHRLTRLPSNRPCVSLHSERGIIRRMATPRVTTAELPQTPPVILSLYQTS